MSADAPATLSRVAFPVRIAYHATGKANNVGAHDFGTLEFRGSRLFESLALVKVDYTLSARSDASLAFIAFHRNDESVKHKDSYDHSLLLSTPDVSHAYAIAQAPVQLSGSFTPSTDYGRELKSTTIGHAPPEFYFGLLGGEDGEYTITYTLHLRASGSSTL